jgi:hypothetical protein
MHDRIPQTALGGGSSLPGENRGQVGLPALSLAPESFTVRVRRLTPSARACAPAFQSRLSER